MKLTGFSTVEILTALLFLSILLTGSYSILNLSLTTAERAKEYTIAELMAHDLLELVTSKRNEDWNSLVPGIYHFVQDPLLGSQFADGAEVVNGYTRQVEIITASRNSNGDLVTSGGTVDPETMGAVATVSWNYGDQAYQVSLTQYFTNWKKF